MKIKGNFLAIIAIVAIITLGFNSCDDGGGGIKGIAAGVDVDGGIGGGSGSIGSPPSNTTTGNNDSAKVIPDAPVGVICDDCGKDDCNCAEEAAKKAQEEADKAAAEAEEAQNDLEEAIQNGADPEVIEQLENEAEEAQNEAEEAQIVADDAAEKAAKRKAAREQWRKDNSCSNCKKLNWKCNCCDTCDSQDKDTCDCCDCGQTCNCEDKGVADGKCTCCGKKHVCSDGDCRCGKCNHGTKECGCKECKDCNCCFWCKGKGKKDKDGKCDNGECVTNKPEESPNISVEISTDDKPDDGPSLKDVEQALNAGNTLEFYGASFNSPGTTRKYFVGNDLIFTAKCDQYNANTKKVEVTSYIDLTIAIEAFGGGFTGKTNKVLNATKGQTVTFLSNSSGDLNFRVKLAE